MAKTSSKRILIVEDEEALSEALRVKLTQAGFETRTAPNGKEALKILEQEAYDLILLDIVMPKKDGFGVMKELKENNIATPVIILTNLGQEADEQQAKELGAARFLVKSNTSLAEIVEIIRSFFRAS